MADRLIYLLYPVSIIYACISYVRNLFYDVGLSRPKKLSVPVISVGNITTGGTGKTPAVAYIARMLQADGNRVGIISRGYKRSTRGYIVVADGEHILVDAKSGGDEPVMLAHAVQGAVVAIHEKRARGGKFMIEDYGVDVIIMDDGFQHRSLHRDLDIVLINASRSDHLRAHLPVGRLRESLQSLRRSHIVVITKLNDDTLFESMEKLVHRYAPVPVLGSRIEPLTCIDVVRNVDVPIENVVSKTAYLFSGIAHPDEFRKTVHDTGVTIHGVRWFTDHYRFTDKDINTLLDEAKKSGADMLLTTEKDATRLHSSKHMFIENMPLYALRVSFSLTAHDNEVLARYIHKIMNKNKRSVTIN